MRTDLDNLSAEELGKLFPIAIAEANPKWREIFEQEKDRLQKVLGPNIALRIEHFGSTAVPGLAAKPTIDILLKIPKNETIKKELVEKMKAAGYHVILRTDCPPAYLMFSKGYTPEGFTGQCFHIHAAPKDHHGLWDRLYFRDFLISQTETANECEHLKKELAVKHQYNHDDYTDAKKEFVQRITELAKKEMNINHSIEA